MKTLVVALALLAAATGTASAQTADEAIGFRIGSSAPVVLPSAETPNAPGEIRLPVAFTTPPAQRQRLAPGALERLWRRAGAAYGIPWPVLAAINKVESNFGRNMGPSSAGAIGWMQFLPSTWLRWGTDASGDGVADPWSAEDAIYSAARYLAAAGGRTDIARGLFAYNHAQWYVDEVLEVAGLYANGAEVTFTLDALAQRLDAAEVDVRRVNRGLLAARRAARRLTGLEARLLSRARNAALLSDRLAARKRAVAIDLRRERATANVERLAAELAAAQTRLQIARERARAASFAPGAEALFGTPAFQDEHVFPVGGGPGLVSVARTHHDYPAADIAAPAGSPVYALTRGVVVAAWPAPDGRCGTGFTMRTHDGATWTYCHLSYLEPAVASGTVLLAGTPVGLVGQTGSATGPHLHLQHAPATSYPQDEPWFQSFAGSAFRWQDEAPDPAAARVFVVVPSSTDAKPDPLVLFTR